MIGSRIGERAGVDNSYLVQSKSRKGANILQIDRTGSGQVDAFSPTLVIREEKGWRPCQNAKELQSFLAASTPQERGANLGVWQQKNRWLVLPPDGELRAKDVTPMSAVWGDLKLHGSDEDRVNSNETRKIWATHHSAVDASEVSVGFSGDKAIFSEPRKIAQTEIQQMEFGFAAATGYVHAVTTSLYTAKSA